MKSILAATVLCAAFVSGCAHEHNVKPAAGYVPNAATAVRIAEAVWLPIYGEHELRSERPFVAELRGEVWHVRGTLPPPPHPGWSVLGGTAIAEIDRRTGRVLRISHDM